MSLFGTTPPDESPSMHSSFARSRQSLFDEEESQSQSQTNSSLFQDDGSPWDMPAPRRQHSRADLLRNLLPAADAPESYIEAFDSVVRDEGGAAGGGKVSSGGVTRVLAAARLDADAQAKIMGILAPGGGDVALGRNEFNVLLGLVGLAQEGETVSLDGIDERRRSECLVLVFYPPLPPIVFSPFCSRVSERRSPACTALQSSHLCDSRLNRSRITDCPLSLICQRQRQRQWHLVEAVLPAASGGRSVGNWSSHPLSPLKPKSYSGADDRLLFASTLPVDAHQVAHYSLPDFLVFSCIGVPLTVIPSGFRPAIAEAAWHRRQTSRRTTLRPNQRTRREAATEARDSTSQGYHTCPIRIQDANHLSEAPHGLPR